MQTHSIIITFGMVAMLAAPAHADFRVSARIGTGLGTVTLQGGDVRNDAWWGPRQRRWHPHHSPKPYPYYVPPYYRSYREDIVERTPVAPPAAPTVPVVAAPAEPPLPPDPRGPVRLMARGGAIASAPYNVGEALPSNLPHVTLDWRHYDLPEPPPGQVYARVGRDVLLITATSRIVESVVPPG